MIQLTCCQQSDRFKGFQGGKSALVVALVIGHAEIVDLLLKNNAGTLFSYKKFVPWFH